VKLSQIHNATIIENVILEALTERQKLGLSILKKMCKDEEGFINDIVKELDPDRAAEDEHRAGKRQELARWIQTAEEGEVRKGTAFGRPVKVKALGEPISTMGNQVKTTVGESVIRGMIAEGRFKKIGASLIKYLANMVSANDDNDESQLVAQVLDEYPELTAIRRYARKAEGDISEDEDFWAVVQRALQSSASFGNFPAPDLEDLKDVMQRTYEMAESVTGGRGLLAECVIVETTVSRIMRKIGVPVDLIPRLMDKHGIEDREFDISDVSDTRRQEAEMVPQHNKDYADEVIKMAGILLKQAEKQANNAAEEEFEPVGEEMPEEY
jgi:hypothetical protein